MDDGAVAAGTDADDVGVTDSRLDMAGIDDGDALSTGRADDEDELLGGHIVLLKTWQRILECEEMSGTPTLWGLMDIACQGPLSSAPSGMSTETYVRRFRSGARTPATTCQNMIARTKGYVPTGYQAASVS